MRGHYNAPERRSVQSIRVYVASENCIGYKNVTPTMPLDRGDIKFLIPAIPLDVYPTSYGKTVFLLCDEYRLILIDSRF